MALIEIREDIVSDTTAWLYDAYGKQCACPSLVSAAVDNLPRNESLTVRVNSGGGNIWAGMQIYSLLSTIRCRVNIEIASIARGAAAVAAMAGGHISMAPSALLVLQNADACIREGYGTANYTFAGIAEVNQRITAAFAARTSLPEMDIREMMDRELCLTAADALAGGFVDVVMDYTYPVPNVTSGQPAVSREMIACAIV